MARKRLDVVLFERGLAESRTQAQALVMAGLVPGYDKPGTQVDEDAELTVTADGAFWSPFGPTVHGGRLDTDLLLTRTTRPLTVPAAAMLRVAGASGARPNPDGPRIC